MKGAEKGVLVPSPTWMEKTVAQSRCWIFTVIQNFLYVVPSRMSSVYNEQNDNSRYVMYV